MSMIPFSDHHFLPLPLTPYITNALTPVGSPIFILPHLPRVLLFSLIPPRVNGLSLESLPRIPHHSCPSLQRAKQYPRLNYSAYSAYSTPTPNQLNVAGKKLHNQDDWTHFKFMTLWWPIVLPTWPWLILCPTLLSNYFLSSHEQSHAEGSP